MGASHILRCVFLYKKKVEKEWRKLHPEEELPSFQEMAEELDFRPILGNEIYLSEEGLCEENMAGGHFWHLILLAKDAKGFKQIKQLSSAAWKRAWFRGILRTPTYPSDLFKFVQGGHLIASTACLGGYTAWCWKQIKETGEKELPQSHGKGTAGAQKLLYRVLYPAFSGSGGTGAPAFPAQL